jgi:DNA-binding NarL/FixJ family response regulator
VTAAAAPALPVAVVGPEDEARARLESLLDGSPATSLQRHEGDAHAYVCGCDLGAAGGLEAITALRDRLDGPLVLVVEEEATARQMKAAVRAGAAGVVRGAGALPTLVATLGAVQAGQLAIPVELAPHLERPVLSRRQKQVLGLVVLGLSNGEIATKLHLSEHTVKCHLYASFRKLGVNSRDEAVSLILDPHEGLGAGILAISDDEMVRAEAAEPVAG